MAEALPEIVERFVKEAKLGSIAHAKALVSLSGLDRAEAMETGRPARTGGGKRLSLTDRLIEELKRGCNVEVQGPAADSKEG